MNEKLKWGIYLSILNAITCDLYKEIPSYFIEVAHNQKKKLNMFAWKCIKLVLFSSDGPTKLVSKRPYFWEFTLRTKCFIFRCGIKTLLRRFLQKARTNEEMGENSL
jgi:hypothetical protein